MRQPREHQYTVTIHWSGNLGAGTRDYRAYGRDHAIVSGAKPAIPGSSDPSFRGDGARWNPEELFVASLSACHQLWYLHLCAVNGVTVIDYRDDAVGTMVEGPEGGTFTRVLLRPHVIVAVNDDVTLATRLHRDAHARCFIANSVNFPVDQEPMIVCATG